ncbi:MAG: hypothetical protein AAF340_15015 [Pseudomonadota bacterium]
MHYLFVIAALLTAPSSALAQDKYDVFIGDYVASGHIVSVCKNFTTYGVQDAATIAKQEKGLRRNKVLRILYYGNTDNLLKLGDYVLASQGVSRSKPAQLCRFAKSIVKNDEGIGRFLRVRK